MGISAVVIWIHDHTHDGTQDRVTFLLQSVTNQDTFDLIFEVKVNFL